MPHLTGHTSNKDALYVECLCKAKHTDDGILTLEDWVLEHAGPKKQKKLNESQELAHCLRVVQVRKADGSLVSCPVTGWMDFSSQSRGVCGSIRFMFQHLIEQQRSNICLFILSMEGFTVSAYGT